MRTKTIAAVLLPLSLLAAACGRLNEGGPPGGRTNDDAIVHPTGSTDLILRVTYEGGFVPVEYNLTRIPSWSLYGDGRIVTEGPQIEIYPGPAVPNLLVRTVDEEGIRAILHAARAAGLMDGDARYPYPCVVDVPSTVFTVTANGTTSIVSADALAVDEGPCMNADVEARAALAEFQTELGALEQWLPEGSLGPEGPFAASSVRLFVQPYPGSPDPALKQRPKPWPLDGSLGRLGQPVPDLDTYRCVALAGADATTFLAEAAEADQLTPWTSGGERYSISIRPLLPDESGC
jgi:hypothetical protein